MVKEKGQKKGSEIPRPEGVLTRAEYLEKARTELASLSYSQPKLPKKAQFSISAQDFLESGTSNKRKTITDSTLEGN